MADPNEYSVGQSVRITAIFKVGGVETDPTTIALTVKTPAGVTTTYTFALAQITKVLTGVYYKDVVISAAGRWYYSWVGTGTVTAAIEQTMIGKTPTTS